MLYFFDCPHYVSFSLSSRQLARSTPWGRASTAGQRLLRKRAGSSSGAVLRIWSAESSKQQQHGCVCRWSLGVFSSSPSLSLSLSRALSLSLSLSLSDSFSLFCKELVRPKGERHPPDPGRAPKQTCFKRLQRELQSSIRLWCGAEVISHDWHR